MTPTPDTALAARLATLKSAVENQIKFDGARSYSTLNEALEMAAFDAVMAGQLITLADHNAAMQAAVAKAVDDTFRSCRTIAASRDTEDDYGDEIARVIEERRLLDAAICARKGDEL